MFQTSQNTSFRIDSNAALGISPPCLRSSIHVASDKITSITHIATSSGRGIAAGTLTVRKV